MITIVVAKVTIHGWHCWQDAIPPVSYLAHAHRHLFVFRAGIHVGHSNRDVEFHLLQGEMMNQLQIYPESGYTPPGKNFAGRSCEQLACEMIKALPYKVAFVEVFEDDENGARVECE